MPRAIDLTGKKFGLLTVKERDADVPRGKGLFWKCICDCGKQITVSAASLKSGNTKSCGCLQRKAVVATGKKNAKKNTYIQQGNYLIGKDASNNTFLVDADDYEVIKDYYWCLSGNGYFSQTANGKAIYLHRLIMNCPCGMVVDHINHDRTDNRKSNLKICTPFENACNRKSIDENHVVGVCYVPNSNKWQANIGSKYLGNKRKTFETKEEAMLQRRSWEKQHLKMHLSSTRNSVTQ